MQVQFSSRVTRGSPPLIFHYPFKGWTWQTEQGFKTSEFAYIRKPFQKTEVSTFSKKQESLHNAPSVLDVQTKNKKIPRPHFFFSILNVVEQVVFSLIPEKEKGPASLLFLNNSVPSLYHI